MAYTNIDDPSAHFQTALWTGTNAVNKVITNDGNSDLKPDLIWAKARTSTSYTDNHFIVDSSRGRTKGLVPNDTSAETTTTGNQSENDLLSFNTDGFTVGIVNSTAALNASSASNVGWQWKANGGTTSSLSNTGPDSVVQVNSDAKFVIGTYTGNGSNSNVKHGLGETPDALIVKRRTGGTGAWAVWHKDLTTAYWLRLETADAQASGVWDGANPTSEKFFITGGSSNVNINGSDYVFYAWKSVQGFSQFGSYIGNGVANDGPFVYLGFKPAFIIIKSLAATGAHYLWDVKRSNLTLVIMYQTLNAAEVDAEGSNTIMTIDALSNGFKVKNTGSNNGTNQSGTKYVYYAWAENPFVTSTGIPATAR